VPVDPHRHLDSQRADRDAARQRELLPDADERCCAAHAPRLHIGVGYGVDAGELQRAKKSPDQQEADDDGGGTSGVKLAQAARNAALISALNVRIDRNPKRRRSRAPIAFMAKAPTAEENVINRNGTATA